MQSLNKNGVSITQTPGEEKFVKCRLGAFRGQIYYQYDYRHTDGELFSTVAKTLDECRRRTSSGTCHLFPARFQKRRRRICGIHRVFSIF